MIPKIIHYCWFGRSPKPENVLKCINSWKKYCPDYQLIEWNEDNFNVSECPNYVVDAYNNKKWAFATDYIRLKVVFEHGGIYFDTDVELLKKIDKLLMYNAFFGFEDSKYINTGLGFGAVKGLNVLKKMMDAYESLAFILDNGSLNQETCPVINTKILLQHGLVQNGKKQILNENIVILPSIYMCPINYETGIMKKSCKTISIHWFDATWMSKEDRNYHENHRRRINEERADRLKYIPNRVLRKILGDARYKALKDLISK